jgi:hypothetical protein
VTPVLLRCTRGLLKLVGNRAGTLIEAEPGIDDWYANVFVIERRKCLLLVHADALFSVLDADVRVAQLIWREFCQVAGGIASLWRGFSFGRESGAPGSVSALPV